MQTHTTGIKDTGKVHCDLDVSDPSEWAAPAWCEIQSVYPEDEESPTYAGANLRGQDFSEARLIMAEFAGAEASEAIFVRSELSGADFRSCNLEGANFFEADLCKADFHWANLAGACLVGADLTVANLSDANLIGANLSGACLEGTELNGARYDKTTELPFDTDEADRRGMKNEEMSRGTSTGGIYE